MNENWKDAFYYWKQQSDLTPGTYLTGRTLRIQQNVYDPILFLLARGENTIDSSRKCLDCTKCPHRDSQMCVSCMQEIVTVPAVFQEFRKKSCTMRSCPTL